MRYKIILFVIILCVPITESHAQFLNIGVGAKACAMGESFVAIANDPSAIYWNPAGLARLNSIEVSVSHNFWLMDMSQDFIGAVYPIRKESNPALGDLDYLIEGKPSPYGVIGAALFYSSSGDIPKYEDFQEVGQYKYLNFIGALSYSKEIVESFFGGIAVKAIYQKMDLASSIGFAADVGILYDLSFMKIGLAVQNIGPKVKFLETAESLPLNIRFGTSEKIGQLTIVSDINKPANENLSANFGFEYNVFGRFGVRAGYNTSNGYTLGVGLNAGIISFDYSYTSFKELNDVHRISAGIKF